MLVLLITCISRYYRPADLQNSQSIRYIPGADELFVKSSSPVKSFSAYSGNVLMTRIILSFVD